MRSGREAALAFDSLLPTAHFVKVEGTSYALRPATVIAPPACADERVPTVAPNTPALDSAAAAALFANASFNLILNVTSLAALRDPTLDGVFRYRWVEDASRAGAAETSFVVQPPNITFLNETVALGDDQATLQLQHRHNILLVDAADDGGDDPLSWSSEYAFRLLEAINAVPRTQQRSFYEPQTLSSKTREIPVVLGSCG